MNLKLGKEKRRKRMLSQKSCLSLSIANSAWNPYNLRFSLFLSNLTKNEKMNEKYDRWNVMCPSFKPSLSSYKGKITAQIDEKSHGKRKAANKSNCQGKHGLPRLWWTLIANPRWFLNAAFWCFAVDRGSCLDHSY